MTARRITITVDEGIDDAEALEAVREVVGRGRISGMAKDTYCYATIFRTIRNGVAVYAWRTRAGNDAFRVGLSERSPLRTRWSRQVRYAPGGYVTSTLR